MTSLKAFFSDLFTNDNPSASYKIWPLIIEKSLDERCLAVGGA